MQTWKLQIERADQVSYISFQALNQNYRIFFLKKLCAMSEKQMFHKFKLSTLISASKGWPSSAAYVGELCPWKKS